MNIVIKPKTIKIDLEHNNKSNEKSPFSNGYDFETATQQFKNVILDDKNKDHYIFIQHKNALDKYLKKNKQNTDALSVKIYSSEDELFNNMGMLTSTDKDYIYLNTKHSIRMWEGENDPSKRRWPGIRYAMALISNIATMAQNDNPFAHEALIYLEERMNDADKYLNQMTQSVDQSLSKLKEKGLIISVLTNPNPEKIEINIKGYGFKFIELLRNYDNFICSILTMKNKGIMSNKDANAYIHTGGNKIRSILQELYTLNKQLQYISFFNRELILKDEATELNKIRVAIQEGLFKQIKSEVLDYTIQPDFIMLMNKYSSEELEKIRENAKKYDLLKSL